MHKWSYTSALCSRSRHEAALPAGLFCWEMRNSVCGLLVCMLHATQTIIQRHHESRAYEALDDTRKPTPWQRCTSTTVASTRSDTRWHARGPGNTAPAATPARVRNRQDCSCKPINSRNSRAPASCTSATECGATVKARTHVATRDANHIPEHCAYKVSTNRSHRNRVVGALAL